MKYKVYVVSLKHLLIVGRCWVSFFNSLSQLYSCLLVGILSFNATSHFLTEARLSVHLAERGILSILFAALAKLHYKTKVLLRSKTSCFVKSATTVSSLQSALHVTNQS